MRGRHLVAVVAALLGLAFPAEVSSHEIPRSITVHVFVKPEAQQLHVLVRVPLAAMRDIQFPLDEAGFVDVPRAEPDLLHAVAQWILPTLKVLENGARVGRPTISAVRVSLPADRSFASYEEAVSHIARAGAAPDVRLPVEQAVLDTRIEYPIASQQSRFAIQPGFERLGIDVVTIVRFVTGDTVRAFELHGDAGVVRLDPRWHQAAWHFVKLGFAHILDGIDHLLFLVLLVVPFRRLRPLILTVTAFTVAHSVTLIASALGRAPNALWFPPLIETLIAGSIVYLALENIVSASTPARRWAVAFGFGLVHGFGFSFALRETLQFAGSHLLTSLVAFNVGVELGQLLVLLALVPLLHVLFRFVVAERAGVIVISALVAHTAWHWMSERWDALKQFPPPAVDLGVWVLVLRVALVAVAVAAAVWLLRLAPGRSSLLRAFRPKPHADASPPPTLAP